MKKLNQSRKVDNQSSFGQCLANTQATESWSGQTSWEKGLVPKKTKVSKHSLQFQLEYGNQQVGVCIKVIKVLK